MGKKKVFLYTSSPQKACGHMCLGGWRLAIGGWWRLVAVGGGWQWLVVDSGWQWLAVGGCLLLTVGGG